MGSYQDSGINIRLNRKVHLPPRKEKCSPEYLRELIGNHKIQFVGPIGTKKWPDKHKDHFADIRAISRLWYDEVEDNEDGDSLTVIGTKKRVEELRKRAYYQRKIRSNGDTWKDSVLSIVTARFDADVVCPSCGDEIWVSEYQAFPANENESVKLQRKRAKRKICPCDVRLRAGKDNDDDGGLSIFDTQCSNEVLHDPEDQLENLSISMRPDRVMGLSTTNSFSKYTALCPPIIRHSPFKDGKILYPFLVIEAKPEKDNPGFKSIEAQSAFPLRRLLKLQDLRIDRGVDLVPLVWFFGFQGDEWRLYAGTLQDSTVKVIDIWHGTILSQDGALQLLYIIDYICDWARNVYHPKIRECLAGGTRDFAPSITFSSSRSQSVLTQATELTMAPPQHELTMEDETLPLRDGKTFHFLSTVEASSHPFFRWATNSHQPDTRTAHTTTRHSDLVNCSFRVLDIPDDAAAFSSLQSSMEQEQDGSLKMFLLLELMQSSRYTMMLTRREIDRLDSCWTDAATNPSRKANARDLEQRVGAFVFLRTFCNPEDWQMNREICCITWSLEAARLVSAIARPEVITIFDQGIWLSPIQVEISKKISAFLSLCGRSSVAYALWNATFSLTSEMGPSGVSRLQWELPSESGMTEAMIARFLRLMKGAANRQAGVHSRNRQSSKLL